MRAVIASAITLLMLSQANAAPLEVRPGFKPPPPPASAKVRPDEIKTQFFNGEPFTAATPAGVKVKMTYTADGKMTREPAGKGGAKSEGTWALNKDGFCTTWKGSKQNCDKLFAKDEKTWSVTGGGSTLATWSK